MAAVVTPSRTTTGPARPHLRLVSPNETAEPVEPLFSPQVVLAAILLTLVLMVGAVAIGRGAFASFAPDAPAAASPSAASSAATTAEAGHTVVVRPGDTLWSIAGDLDPAGDIRPLVDRLVAAHGSTSIAPGDRITFDG